MTKYIVLDSCISQIHGAIIFSENNCAVRKKKRSQWFVVKTCTVM